MQFYSYTATATGLLSAKACAGGFNATVTVMTNGPTAGSGQVVLDCGTCAAPSL